MTSEAGSETVPPPDTTGPAATQAAGTTNRATMERVVRTWSEELNAGRDRAAARLFELPALVAQANAVLEFRTYEDLTVFHEDLPCSGTVVSISYDEPAVALAVFELGDRSPGSCDAPPGTLAAARFVFRDGRLYGWQQVPVPDEAATFGEGPVA